MDQKTFSNILSTTEQLVKEKGCQSTTLQMIMERTGLSKGAIYHYVKSKDELFGKILKGYMEEVNQQFHQAVEQSKGLDIQPAIQAIVSSFAEREVSNSIFIYLLSQQHNTKITDILKELHQDSITLSKTWITIGQQQGVIPSNIDAAAFTAMFVTMSYGLRVSQMIGNDEQSPKLKDIFRFMVSSLQGRVQE